MMNQKQLKTVFAALVCGAATCIAQEFNLWRGGEGRGDWNDPYKWKLLHVPSIDEAVHFRQSNSVITVNGTIELDNGMMLYGHDLLLEGHGNINLRSPVSHRSTVNIPASATGEAHLTVTENLELSGRIALAANAFATPDSKGSVTLKDHSSIKGKLAIGHGGNGSGQVFIEDQATLHISELELHTLAESGGTAEIHVLGGTVHLEANTRPFETYLEDPSRTIIIDEAGTLQIDSDWPIQHKIEMISEMISKERIIAARNCQLKVPVIKQNMILFRAEFTSKSRPLATLLDDIQKVQQAPANAPAEDDSRCKMEQLADHEEVVPVKSKTSKLESLLQEMRTNRQPETIAAITPPPKPAVENTPEPPPPGNPAPLGGYIVFFSAILFLMRPQKSGN